jgi:hypothetical protein
LEAKRTFKWFKFHLCEQAPRKKKFKVYRHTATIKLEQTRLGGVSVIYLQAANDYARNGTPDACSRLVSTMS